MLKAKERRRERHLRIERSIEGDAQYRMVMDAQRSEPEATTPDAITAASRQVAQTLKAAAIVCWTGSGSTGLRASRERPGVPIIALTPVATTGRRLAIAWGLHCVVTEDAHDHEDMVDHACQIAFREGFASVGQRIVVTAGVPLGTPGATNLLRVGSVSLTNWLLFGLTAAACSLSRRGLRVV